MNDNRMLICDIQMFDATQTIIYSNGERIQIPTEIISSYVVSSCYHNNNLDGIHFFGNESYIQGIINDIYIENEINYSNLKEIKIEVN